MSTLGPIKLREACISFSVNAESKEYDTWLESALIDKIEKMTSSQLVKKQDAFGTSSTNYFLTRTYRFISKENGKAGSFWVTKAESHLFRSNEPIHRVIEKIYREMDYGMILIDSPTLKEEDGFELIN